MPENSVVGLDIYNSLAKLSNKNMKALVLIGATDSGKTSFVNYCAVNETLPSKTEKFCMTEIKKGFFGEALLIDTPGFGSQHELQDYEIISQMKTFLDHYYAITKKQEILGFILFHSLTAGDEKLAQIRQYIQFLLIAFDKKLVQSMLICLTKADGMDNEIINAKIKQVENLVPEKIKIAVWSNTRPVLHQETKLLKCIDDFIPYTIKVAEFINISLENKAIKQVIMEKQTKNGFVTLKVKNHFLQKNTKNEEIKYFEKIERIDKLDYNCFVARSCYPSNLPNVRVIDAKARFLGQAAMAKEVIVECYCLENYVKLYVRNYYGNELHSIDIAISGILK